MMRVPGERPPQMPTPISHKEVGKEKEATNTNRQDSSLSKTSQVSQHSTPPATAAAVGRSPDVADAHAIAVRLAAVAIEAKEKEIKAEDFEKILEQIIEMTGMKEPQAAMEEANRRRQKEIDIELEKIKSNKDLMDEAQDWQEFANLLASMKPEQVEAFIGMLKESVRELT